MIKGQISNPLSYPWRPWRPWREPLPDREIDSPQGRQARQGQSHRPRFNERSLFTPIHHHQRHHRNPQTPPPSLSQPSSISPSSPASVEAPQPIHKTNFHPPPLLQLEGPNPMIPSDSLLCSPTSHQRKTLPRFGKLPRTTATIH
jgi:hypothetical protein